MNLSSYVFVCAAIVVLSCTTFDAFFPPILVMEVPQSLLRFYPHIDKYKPTNQPTN
jgi:hypothetical protein